VNLASQIEAKREFGELVCQQLLACIEKIAFPAEIVLSYPNYQNARFELIQDPFTGLFNLSGFWHDSRGQRIGRLQFQSDDSCYAEYDVVQNHPTKKQWFVEKVTAWGKIDTLKAEATLLALPS
jgi:hypothetical protein